VRLLVRALAREPAIEQRLVTGRGSELARRAAGDGVGVREVAWTMGLDPRAWWRLVLQAREFRPDIIHAHNSHALSLALWARTLLARTRRDPPHIVFTRRVLFPVRRGSGLFRADRIIVISEAVRAALAAAGAAPARVALVPSGVDADEVRRAAAFPLDIRARLGLPPTAPIAANIAALEPAKDHATLLGAAAHARALRPDLHWVIAGGGKLRTALVAQAGRLGLTDRVHFIGWTDHPEALMREADVVAMSSRSEGLGTAVLDALALGKPVVATSGGGLAEIVPPRWLVGVGDARALGEKVVQAVNHPAPFPLPSQFTASAMARGVLAVYRSLI
jgi:glycosyltransferase involved in cell wall biosynthesis